MLYNLVGNFVFVKICNLYLIFGIIMVELEINSYELIFVFYI